MPTPAPNNLLTVEQTLWTIALAWPGLTGTTPPLLKVGNAIRFDGKNGWPDATKLMRQPADAVEFKLEIGSGRRDPKAPRTFCIQPDVRSVAYEWTLTAADKRYQQLTQCEAELRAAMKSAGTQLGIPAIVARWEWDTRPARTDPQQNQRAIIITQTITIKG